MENSFYVIPNLTWKWFEFIIFFYLTFISLWEAIYTLPVTKGTLMQIWKPPYMLRS